MHNELNHNGTLFGRAAIAIANKPSFIKASLAFPSAEFVTKVFGEFNFLLPAKQGDTSDTISIQAYNTKRGKTHYPPSLCYGTTEWHPEAG